MARHRVFAAAIPQAGEALEVTGEEAAHASGAKRLREGDAVGAFDGRGTVAACVVRRAARSTLVLEVTERLVEPAVTPMVEAWTATPKGPRLEKMIDQLAQVGAASWVAMGTSLGVVDPGAGKLARVERVVLEGCKQCGRSWLMEVGGRCALGEALSLPGGGGTSLVLADGRGGRYAPTGCERVRVLVGPEGGFTEAELASARDAGAQVVSLGPHVLRIETAAVVAVSAVLLAEGAFGG